ncbi:TetR/AcrR family transcriptional regulator [Mycobacterium haemophilum]
MPSRVSRKPGRPPAAKADETRKRIVRVAREVFSERGYDGATFQAIAVRADLTRPAINHYFSSKRALYREVVDQTNQLVVAASIDQAKRETTLIRRVSVLINLAMQAHSDNPAASAFLVTNVLESQRHPELSHAENDAVRLSRDFLSWAVKDAIESGELASGIDAYSLTETLLVVLCGVGFYAGYLRSPKEMEAVTETLGQLLSGALWRPNA